MRITRPQLFMEIAHVVAKRSTCFRLNVGAIVVINNRIVSIGYNGRAAGEPHCQGDACPGRYGCGETIHAEHNAIRHIPHALRHVPFDLYVTDSPCSHCAMMMLKSGCETLYFGKLYRIHDHLDSLAQKVNVRQVTPAGYVIDWKTKGIIDD